MLIGYARVSKTDGSQSLDLQRDAPRAVAVDEVNLYHDRQAGQLAWHYESLRVKAEPSRPS